MCSCIERCSVEAGLKRAEEGDDRNWAGEESRPRREGLCDRLKELDLSYTQCKALEGVQVAV